MALEKGIDRTGSCVVRYAASPRCWVGRAGVGKRTGAMGIGTKKLNAHRRADLVFSGVFETRMTLFRG